MSVYKKPNGKWYCRFQIDGERHHYLCNGAICQKDAEKIESAFKYKLMQQINGVIPKEKEKIKLSVIYDDFLKYSQTNKISWKHDDGRLKIIKEFWKNKKYAEDVKPDDIEELKIHLLNRGLSKATVNKYLTIVSKMFSLAIDNDLIDKSPFKKAKFKIKHYQLRTLDKGDEQERLYKASSECFYGIIFVALNSGLRKSNIQYLQGKNIRLDYKIFEFTENKGNKHIKIPMTDAIYEYFSKLEFTDEDYIFKQPNGRLWSNTAFHREWHNILERANIKNLRFHDLRHTVGTRMAENNIPVPVIQRIFAHSNIQTTMQYIHTAEEQMLKAMEVLNSYN